jgi:RNA polymerase sigma-70 factor (ECF subfamily)
MEASRALAQARPAPAAQQAPARLRHAADRALENLYESHARDVYQYALALLANPADAEDATQATFLNAYRALLRGDRPHRPHNWLITITHNVCRMRWRQASHRPREVALDEAPEPVSLERERPDLAELLNALAGLSFNQRAALVMRELEGRSCKEIAKTLDLSVSSVEALLFRARRRLQLERDSLGVLTTAPFPAAKVFSALGLGGGGGGGAAAAGGAAVGADHAHKALAVLAVGAIVTGAVGVATHVRQLRDAVSAKSSGTAPALVRGATPAMHRKHAAPARATHKPGTGGSSKSATTRVQAPAGTAQAAQAPPSGTAATTQLPANAQLPSLQLPQLPQVGLPQVQLPQAQVPQLPQLPQVPQLPQPPQLPVTLPVQLPPAPQLPPVPPLGP